jgi:hypothetical protein
VFDKLVQRTGLSPLIVAIIVVLGVVQITMQVYALFDLTRRETVEGGKKWVWAAAVLIGGLLGTIAYLAVGRPPVKVDVADAGIPKDEAARRAVDVLYDRGQN